ncbi:hypothetical protein [Methylobacterium sp. Gmos1]
MTVPAPTDRAAERERIVKAAVEWVTDPGCASALAELEDAVAEFTAGADERLCEKLAPSAEAIERRARSLCADAGLHPDFMAYQGQDDHGYAIREPNWMLFAEEAEEELRAARATRTALASKEEAGRG